MGDRIDDTKPPSNDWSTPDDGESAESSGSTTREWLSQLQSMIDNAATQARPVLREVAAKAAELAAVAGEKAGPIAHKAAEVTAQAGSKVAERGREVAADLRRDNDEEHATPAEPPTAIETLEPGGGPTASTVDTTTGSTETTVPGAETTAPGAEDETTST
jgi:hypothetical protein